MPKSIAIYPNIFPRSTSGYHFFWQTTKTANYHPSTTILQIMALPLLLPSLILHLSMALVSKVYKTNRRGCTASRLFLIPIFCRWLDRVSLRYIESWHSNGSKDIKIPSCHTRISHGWLDLTSTPIFLPLDTGFAENWKLVGTSITNRRSESQFRSLESGWQVNTTDVFDTKSMIFTWSSKSKIGKTGMRRPGKPLI